MSTHHDFHDIPELQPRGHLTRFSAKRLAQLREQDAAQYRLPRREADRFGRVDLGECAIWLCIILGAIVLAWRHDTPTGGLALPSCAATTVAQQESAK